MYNVEICDCEVFTKTVNDAMARVPDWCVHGQDGAKVLQYMVEIAGEFFVVATKLAHATDVFAVTLKACDAVRLQHSRQRRRDHVRLRCLRVVLW